MTDISWFQVVYTFLGGLGMFFFAMKTLSEALQAIAGTLIRQIIHSLTSNRLVAVAVGASVTTLVQSSSVTTVMVVGFVNAGLMELTQAIGVIFGANIGTTITGWIIAVKVGKYGLLLVAMGAFPIIFAKSSTVQNGGRVFLALGFVFMGLEFMSSSFAPLRGAPAFLDALQYFTADNYLTLLACVSVGMVLTFVIQSSSAMLGITMALAASGVISFQTAVALVFGENIGTTITALLASVGTNTTARRAARAHAVFNVLGVVWISLIFWFFLDIVEAVIPGLADARDADGSKTYIAAHIAAAHTIFNVANTILFVPLLGYVAKLVTWMTPGSGDERPKLQYLPGTSWTSPPVAIVAAEQELENLARVCTKLFRHTRSVIERDSPAEGDLQEIVRLEDITDSIQAEITLFLCRVQEGELTPKQSADCYALIRAADELESIADYCRNLARYRANLDKKGQKLSLAACQDLVRFFDRVFEFYEQLYEELVAKRGHNLHDIRATVEILKTEGNRIRRSHRERLEAGTCNPVSGMFFSDMIVALRKIRSHIVNVAEALSKVDLTE